MSENASLFEMMFSTTSQIDDNIGTPSFLSPSEESAESASCIEDLDIKLLIRFYLIYNPSKTIADVANILQVSSVTVSRILSGSKKRPSHFSEDVLSELSDNVDYNAIQAQVGPIKYLHSYRMKHSTSEILRKLYTNGSKPTNNSSCISRKYEFDRFKRTAKIYEGNRILREIAFVSAVDISAKCSFEEITALFSRFETDAARKEILCINDNVYPWLVLTLSPYCADSNHPKPHSDEIHVVLADADSLKFKRDYQVFPAFHEIIIDDSSTLLVNN